MPPSPHPLWLLLTSYGAGLLIGGSHLAWPLAAALLAGAALRGDRRTTLCLAALLAGLWREPQPAPPLRTSEPVRLTGTVIEGPDPLTGQRQRSRRASFVLLAEGARLLVAVGRGCPSIAPGDLVMVEGLLRPFSPPRNPGEPGRHWLLAQRKIVAFLQVDSTDACRILEVGSRWSLRRLAYRLRSSALRQINATLPPDVAAMTAALVLGERSGLDPVLRDRFRATGTYHLLAISGLHLGLILGGARWILARAGLGRRTRGLVMLAGCGLYMAVAGFTPSIVRAGAMGSLYALGDLMRRSLRGVDVVPAAALAVLVVDPMQARSIGFQLSLAAMAGIVFGTSAVRRLGRCRRHTVGSLGILGGAWRNLKRGLLVSCAACLFTAPLSARYFGQIVPWSPIFSILMVPWLATFLTAALPLAFGPWPVTACLVEALARFATWALTYADRLPLTPLHLQPVPLVSLILAGGALLALIRCRPRVALGLALAASTASLLAPAGRPRPGELRSTVLAVGHGLACTVQTGGGACVLIDAGSSGIPGVGRRVLEPALRRLGVERLDLLVLTHLDADHVSGVPDLAARFPIEQAVVPTCLDQRPAARDAIDALIQAGVVLTVPEAGRSSISIDSLSITVERLHPPRHIATNVDSLVVCVEDGGHRVLIPGDQEPRALLAGVSTTQPLPLDLLILPHHGRPAPGLERLLSRLDPRLAVASCGRQGVAVSLESAFHGTLLETWRDGAVLVEWRPTGLTWTCWSQSPETGVTWTRALTETWPGLSSRDFSSSTARLPRHTPEPGSLFGDAVGLPLIDSPPRSRPDLLISGER